MTTTVKTLKLYDGLVVVDEIIAKTLNVSEISQIARAEKRARALMLKAWLNALKKAVDKMVPMLLGTSTLKKTMLSADNILVRWAEDVIERYLAEIERSYYFARIAAWKKVTGQAKGSLQYDVPNITSLDSYKKIIIKAAKKPPLMYASVKPNFDLADEAAVNALKDRELFWIGSYYDEGVRSSLVNSAKGVIETGRGRSWGSEQLRKHLFDAGIKVDVPDGFKGSTEMYFRGLVANVVTVARAQGQLRSFVDLGVTRYEIVNPLDRRTCEVCEHMNGKIFTVEHGSKVMESEIAAEKPSDIKSAHPWIHFNDLKQISSKAGHVGIGDAKNLADAGFSMPEFHFFCRCTIDVSEEAGSFEPLETMPIGSATMKLGGIEVVLGNALLTKKPALPKGVLPVIEVPPQELPEAIKVPKIPKKKPGVKTGEKK